MRVKVKRSGSVFIGVTVFLGVAAANTGNNLLYMIVSSMLALMLISGLSSIINIRGIRLILIPPEEVFAGRKTRFRLVAKKEGRLPSFLVRVSSPIDSALFPLIADKPAEEQLFLVFPRRGAVGKVRLEVSSDFPLGMFVRYIEVEVDVSVIVFPEPLPARLPVESNSYQEEGNLSYTTLVRGYEELRNIKEYGGEPMKLIHWKLSAKKEKLMVKEMVQEERQPIVLKMDMVEGDTETKLSKLAYLTVKLIEMDYPVGLEIGEKAIPPKGGSLQKRLILRELALY